MTEDQIRELFREMRDEPVPPDSQARVRMAVADRIRNRRRWWIAAAAVLVPVCMLVAVLFPRSAKIPAAPPAVVKPVPVEVTTDSPPVENPPPRVLRARRRVVKPRHETVTNAASLIRIETDDPNVVILLIGG